MDLVELRDLVNWVKQHVKTPNIVQQYQALRDILRQNTQGGQQQPYETQRNALLDAVSQVPIDMLSMQRRTCWTGSTSTRSLVSAVAVSESSFEVVVFERRRTSVHHDRAELERA